MAGSQYKAIIGLYIPTVKFSDGSSGASFNNVVFTGGGTLYSTTGVIIVRNATTANITTTATIVSTTGKSARVSWTGNNGVSTYPFSVSNLFFRRNGNANRGITTKAIRNIMTYEELSPEMKAKFDALVQAGETQRALSLLKLS